MVMPFFLSQILILLIMVSHSMSFSPSSIKITVKTEFLPKQSSLLDGQYVFTYTITIANLGDQNVTLKSRHWLITDANGEISEVKGPGVVGETPTIAPGAGYQYTSGTVFETPIGFMQGSYFMVTEQGQEIEAKIPTFRLAAPGVMQ
jgi:ApaG protein